jgi:hypothetical protein
MQSVWKIVFLIAFSFFQTTISEVEHKKYQDPLTGEVRYLVKLKGITKPLTYDQETCEIVTYFFVEKFESILKNFSNTDNL